MLCNYHRQATKGPFVPLFLQHPNSSFLHTSLSLFSVSFIFCGLCHGLWVWSMVGSVLLFLFSCTSERSFRISSIGRVLYLLQGWELHLCHLSPLSFSLKTTRYYLSVRVWVHSKICYWSDNKFPMLIPYKPAKKLRVRSVSPCPVSGWRLLY